MENKNKIKVPKILLFYCGVLTLIGICIGEVSVRMLDTSLGDGLTYRWWYYVIGFVILTVTALCGNHLIDFLTRKPLGAYLILVCAVALSGVSFFTDIPSFLVPTILVVFLVGMPTLIYTARRGNLNYTAFVWCAVFIFPLTTDIISSRVNAYIFFIIAVISIFYSRKALNVHSIIVWMIVYMFFREVYIGNSSLLSIIITLVVLAFLFVYKEEDIFICNKYIKLGVVLLTCIFSFFIMILDKSFIYYNIVKSVISPETDPINKGYIPLLVRSLLSESKLFGQGELAWGLENMSQHSYYTTNYLAYLSNSFGLWVITTAIVLYLAFFCICIFKAQRLTALPKSIAWTIMFYLMVQTILFFSSNLGFPFVLTVSLPFISCNYYLWSNMALIGLLIAMFTVEQKNQIQD